MQDLREQEKRWDMHSERQVAASKGAATAVTVLNSGSWLALLSQSGKLVGENVGTPIGWWGAGAFLGTLIWLFIYLGALLLWMHDQERTNSRLRKINNANICAGVLTALASMFCFAMGVITLAQAFQV